MTYRLTRADADLLDEALSTGIPSDDDLRAAQLIAPDLRKFDPRWQPSALHRDRATRAIRTAREKAREGAAIYDLVDYPDAGVVCRVILQAAHSEQAWSWEAEGDERRLDKAGELRRLARLIERHYDEHPTEGQVIAHLARELEIAREEYGADASRAQRLAATIRELLDEAEPAAAEPLAYRSAEGELSYPSVRRTSVSGDV
ncbi:hypothetical protein V1260_15110 [Brachybacterium sp. J144]|uniref:hypothetical protein n=1 Tax=Brachybacterium sp. J144 TaxID=3116487 RepID=UPI000CD24953|nr:hypothetical protein [Brachybacterium sp. J144]MEE1652109.1 hypothetical protein [Brachybacterium sp. J144]